MAGYQTAWIIGSVKDLSYALEVDATVGSVSGSRYLYHPTGSLSILDAVRLALVAAGYAGAAVVLTRDRRVRISSGAGNVAVTWTDTGLRDLLGFVTDLSGAPNYTATYPSPLLWSPAKPLASELSPRGTYGIRRSLTYMTQSPSDGSTFAFSHGTRTDQRYSCACVDIDRVMTASNLGGEWARFFDEVIAKGFSFYVYLDVTEESGSSTTATLTGGLGPYVVAPDGRAARWAYQRARGFEWTDKRADVVVACRDAPEYD